MPIEIRELVIKTTISNENNSAANSGGGDDGGGPREAIIAECVDQVMEILKSKSER